MSDITISSLARISREALAEQLLATPISQTTTPNPSSSTSTTPTGTSSSTCAQSPPGSSTTPAPSIAIVDVRDGDHIGGHIRGSTWVPSSELDFRTPQLVRDLQDKDVVVFHCALSQQRGPSAALRYLREKRRLDGEGSVSISGGVVKEGFEKVDGEGKEGLAEGEGKGKKKVQKVLVLEGGFTKWQEAYGSDERLTEGWQKDIWEWGN
ncbi:uncharacterized protein EI97DRAFT_450816 [Westerdykella ornata]|uniref:Rhodanese domain-containing protein n=1 Tax=Westerdykella ornata TaxID=318751 RepID=A0A6A6JI14_WESOR|nr:uncharacterized protein EI97DRAFT_450816 [Westerdykella ornata]KAF2275598.1 hypothetical protein EI97DRAFT_450816 [Westerdykella ornata]